MSPAEVAPAEVAPVEYRDPHELIMARLAAPFANVKRRTGAGGRVMEYIDAYMAMNRLDDVLGPSNWEDEFTVTDTCVYCKITITFPDGEVRSRGDASGFDVKDAKGNVIPNSKVKKTAFSDAFKRAARKFGVGRYLMTGGKQANYYRRIAGAMRQVPDPPAPEATARDWRGSGKTSEPPAPDEFPSRPNNPQRPGVALFKLATTPENKRNRMLESVVQFGEENAFPQKIVDWSYEQVNAYCEDAGIDTPYGEVQ